MTEQTLLEGSLSMKLRRPIVGGSCRRLVALLFATALLLPAFSEDAEARGRGRSRSSAAAAKAQRQRMINITQQQVAAARRVLSAAESQAAMSQVEVTQAINKLSEIRESLKAAQSSTEDAAKSMHDLEAEIVGEQKPDSELLRAQADFEAAKHDLHRVMHRVLTLPKDAEKSSDAGRLGDLAKLMPEEKMQLEGDVNYQVAQDKMKTAARNVRQFRQKLLEADPVWVAARQELSDSEQSTQESNQQGQTAGLGSLADHQDLRKAKNIAAAARAVVAQGEARLRQLGVNPAATQGTTSGSKNKKAK